MKEFCKSEGIEQNKVDAEIFVKEILQGLNEEKKKKALWVLEGFALADKEDVK